MGEKHYKLGVYRLSDETINNIKDLKLKSGESYNILFVNFIKLHKKYGFYETNSNKSEFRKKTGGKNVKI